MKCFQKVYLNIVIYPDLIMYSIFIVNSFQIEFISNEKKLLKRIIILDYLCVIENIIAENNFNKKL